MSGILPRRALLVGSAALALPLAAHARSPAIHHAAWPSRPIRLVVPFAPGGTTERVARLLAQGLQDQLGQPVIIGHRAGAAAGIGSLDVAQAAPDGHTLLVSTIASHGAASSLHRSPRYDAVRDFTHIALVVETPLVLVASPRFPAARLADVVRLSQEDGRGIHIASSGPASRLLVLQFGQATGAHVNQVPYRGAGPAMTDTIAGVVPMLSDSLPSATAHIRGGAVRALALSAGTRHPALPAVPTFREQGIDLVSTAWFGLSGPAGLPPEVTERLAQAVAAVLAKPALRARFAEIGGTAGALGPADYTDFVRAEASRWAPVVQASDA